MSKSLKTVKARPAVLLSRAPFVFWPALYADEPDAAVAVPRWIAEQTAGKRTWPGFELAALSDENAPKLTRALRFDPDAGAVHFEHARPDVTVSWSAPLFPTGLGVWMPGWKTRNPLDAILDNKLPNPPLDEGARLFAEAVRRVGDDIVRRLASLLSEGKLIASARSVTDPLSDLRDIPASQIADATLNLQVQRLESRRAGTPVLIDVQVRAAVELPADKSGGQSFEAADKPLIEEMYQLIRSGKAKNVTAAAGLVAPKAKSIGTVESTIKRLRTRYTREHPTRSQR